MHKCDGLLKFIEKSGSVIRTLMFEKYSLEQITILMFVIISFDDFVHIRIFTTCIDILCEYNFF